MPEAVVKLAGNAQALPGPLRLRLPCVRERELGVGSSEVLTCRRLSQLGDTAREHEELDSPVPEGQKRELPTWAKPAGEQNPERRLQAHRGRSPPGDKTWGENTATMTRSTGVSPNTLAPAARTGSRDCAPTSARCTFLETFKPLVTKSNRKTSPTPSTHAVRPESSRAPHA